MINKNLKQKPCDESNKQPTNIFIFIKLPNFFDYVYVIILVFLGEFWVVGCGVWVIDIDIDIDIESFAFKTRMKRICFAKTQIKTDFLFCGLLTDCCKL